MAQSLEMGVSEPREYFISYNSADADFAGALSASAHSEGRDTDSRRALFARDHRFGQVLSVNDARQQHAGDMRDDERER